MQWTEFLRDNYFGLDESEIAELDEYDSAEYERCSLIHGLIQECIDRIEMHYERRAEVVFVGQHAPGELFTVWTQRRVFTFVENIDGYEPVISVVHRDPPLAY